MTLPKIDDHSRSSGGDGARSVVDRALTILGTFQGNRSRQALSDISRNSGLPIATCYRIVQRLVDWGALERDGENRYRIGLRLWEVASRAPRAQGLQRIARPYLLDLYETTGFASHLAIREGSELVSIERFQNPRRAVRRPVIGGRYQLHVTAIGQVLLAHAPQDIQDDVLGGELTAFTKNTYTDRAVLERVLADIRRTGFAVSDRQVDDVYVGVAAPIKGADGKVAAALSLAMEVAEDKPDVQGWCTSCASPPRRSRAPCRPHASPPPDAGPFLTTEHSLGSRSWLSALTVRRFHSRKRLMPGRELPAPS